MSDMVSFDDTQKAFSLKDDKELHRSIRLFRLIHSPFLVKVGSKLAVIALKLHLPVKNLIRKTIFSQFCAGESIEESKNVVKKLASFKVGSILDYSAEGSGREEDFERTRSEIIRIIGVASKDPSIPYTCLKMSGIASHAILEKAGHPQKMNTAERTEFQNAMSRFESICAEAEMKNVPIYIDAEESWIQIAIDRMTEEMMWKHNANSAIVNTTLQMYRSDRLSYLRQLIRIAREKKRFLGIKLVRGAYIEKENKRARDMGYPTPILPDKRSTDIDFDKAVDICLENIDSITLCAGTHNEQSTFRLVQRMNEMGIPNNHPHIFSSQLFGMSDHISFNLAAAGYNVTKYLPYGPINTVLPYLVRRAEENSGIAGQMGRELKLLTEEKKRRDDMKLLMAPAAS